MPQLEPPGITSTLPKLTVAHLEAATIGQGARTQETQDFKILLRKVTD